MHPKFDHYPHSRDYVFAQVFRPFVGFVHPPMYRSAAVNTDRFGLREQYDLEGRFINLEAARATYPSCTALVGGSTAFGVGASSDKLTVAVQLAHPDQPCINLAVRAASARHELAMFLALKHLLPPVEAVILFSGVNDCLLAATPRATVFPGYGAAFAQHIERLQEINREGLRPAETPPGRQARVIDRVGRRSRELRDRVKVLTDRDGQLREARGDVLEDLEGRTETMMAIQADTIESWHWLGRGAGFAVEYVLQPLATWVGKRLTPVEIECLDADRSTIPEIAKFGSVQMYERVKQNLTSACSRFEIPFHDSNEWLGPGEVDSIEVFLDAAHLTDEGSRVIAGRMRKELQCLSPGFSAPSPGST